jgi:hypothetical protein
MARLSEILSWNSLSFAEGSRITDGGGGQRFILLKLGLGQLLAMILDVAGFIENMTKILTRRWRQIPLHEE